MSEPGPKRGAARQHLQVTTAVLIGLLSVFIGATRVFTDPLALGNVVIGAQFVGVPLLGVVTVLLLVLVFLPRGRAASGVHLWGRWLGRILAVAGALLAWPVIVFVWFLGSATPTGVEVLVPVGPSGCRVVVSERSFLRSGGGRVHVVPAGRVLATQVGSFGTHDGSLFGSGEYRLSWDGEQANLLLIPSDGARVSPEELSFSCG